MSYKYGHWSSPVAVDPNQHIGFIYQITNMVTGKKYIGRKNLTSNRRKQVRCKTNPDKKKSVRVIKSSNWETYTSSSTQLNADIKTQGKDQFRFEILSVHKTKSELNYFEVVSIITAGALTNKLPNGEPEYYNGCCPPIKTRPVFV